LFESVVSSLHKTVIVRGRASEGTGKCKLRECYAELYVLIPEVTAL